MGERENGCETLVTAGEQHLPAQSISLPPWAASQVRLHSDIASPAPASSRTPVALFSALSCKPLPPQGVIMKAV